MGKPLSFMFRPHLLFTLCRYYDFAKEHGIPLPTLEKKGFVKYTGSEGLCTAVAE